MPKVHILGVDVDDIDTPGLEEAILNSAKKDKKEIFAYANIHTINISRRNAGLRQFLNKASIVYCDGDGLRLGAKVLGLRLPAKTVLTRWIWKLGGLLQEHNMSVFLLGGRNESVAAAANRWRLRFPQLKILGFHHGYFDRMGEENAKVVAMINKGCPNVLFVGFGTPEQELWIRDNFDNLKVNSIIPCGGMIDYLSGEVKSPPQWMVD